MTTFILEGEEHEVGDRVRLKNAVNGIKASALCNILKIKSDKEIQVQSVYDDSKATVSVEDLELLWS